MPELSDQWYLIEKPDVFRYLAPSMFSGESVAERMEVAVEHACTEWDKAGKFWVLTARPVQYHVVRAYSAKVQPRI